MLEGTYAHGLSNKGWTSLGLYPHLQMLSFMHAQYSFFQQGYSLLHQLDPYMKKLAAEVSLQEWLSARAFSGGSYQGLGKGSTAFL